MVMVMSPDEVVEQVRRTAKVEGFVRINDTVFSCVPGLNQVVLHVLKNGLILREFSWQFPHSKPVLGIHIRGFVYPKGIDQ